MTTYLGKSCSFGLPRVPFVNCCQFMYLVISLLVLRAGCRIWLYQFLIIAYLFTLIFSSSCAIALMCSSSAILFYEPRHDKTNKMSVRPAKTQISLGIRPVWSEFSLCAQWVAKVSSCGQRRLWSDWADAQADLSLRWAHTHFVGFVMSRLILFLHLFSISGSTWKVILDQFYTSIFLGYSSLKSLLLVNIIYSPWMVRRFPMISKSCFKFFIWAIVAVLFYLSYFFCQMFNTPTVLLLLMIVDISFIYMFTSAWFTDKRKVVKFLATIASLPIGRTKSSLWMNSCQSTIWTRLRRIQLLLQVSLSVQYMFLYFQPYACCCRLLCLLLPWVLSDLLVSFFCCGSFCF